MIWFYFQKKIELHFGCGPCWPSFCPNRVLRRAIFNNFTKFFFKTTMITQVININSMSQHISLEISKKNPQWVELKGKIWHKQSATYLTCFALGKLNDEYQEILVLLHFPTPPPPFTPSVIDDSSWKNMAESFTIVLILTLGGGRKCNSTKISWSCPIK